nr:PAS domain S-box protein [Deinobacterium chartae]
MQAHAALQRSEDRFRSLVAASVDIVWVTDPVGSVLERMPSWEKFCGVTHEVLSGFGWLDTLHPDDRPSTLEAWQRALSTRGRYEVEYRVLRHDGTYRLMHVRGVPVLDGHGNVREWIGNCTDITDRRRAEEQVTRLAQIVEASNDFIGIADLEGHAHFVNRSGRELLGLDEAEVPTTNVLDYFMPEDRATVRDVVLPVLFRQGRWQSDTRFRHFRTGEAIDVDWTLFLIRDPRTGDPTGIATVTRDIRERKRTEVALQEQTDILTTLNRINQTISAELDQSKLVQAVTDAGVELTGAQFGALFYNVKTENEESYTLYTLSGVPREAFASFPMPRNTQVFGPTFEGIGVVRVDDITKDPRYGHNPPYQGMPKGHLPVCSYLAAPVILRTGEVLGGLFFGHPEPGVFTERAEQLAVGLAAQTAVALDNARLYQQLQSSNALLEQRVQERTRQLEEQAASLDAFAAFTEAVGTETDAYAIARQAVALLRTRFPNASVGFYEPADNLWKLRVWSDNFSPQTLEVLQAGVPTETPIVTETLRTHQAVFVDAWDQEPEQIAHTEEYGAVGNYPLVVNGEVRGFLAIGQRYQQQWTERDKAMFSAVGRGFTLALERAEQTARIESQRDALEARARALEGFAQLTRNFALETDPFALVRHAQEILLSLLSNGYVLYWQPEEQLWRNRSQVGSLGNPALQEVIDAGLPYGQSPTIDTPWLTQQPFLEDVYTRGADTDPELVQHVNAVAMLPVLVNGIPHGIIGVGLFDQRHWTDTDRAVLETVAHSLGLALEGVESNRALQERTRELERSNAELERFAYVASHDLQEPLRTIASFTELINRRYGDLMDENGRKYLGFVTRGAERMKLLIDDLLVFSRLNTIREPHQPLSLEEPFQEAVQRLYSTIEASGAVITHDPFPTVMGDVSELTQLFQNLIGNAVKFRHPDRRPEVHVGVEREKDCWHVRVRDNGIGFEQKYADRIFQIFQRLHLREKYEGTGMGLAIVRKIVEHHSGRVWAESEPGKGSTFHFTVPVVDPEFPNPGETEPC